MLRCPLLCAAFCVFVIPRALAAQSQPGQKHALQLAQAAIWLEQQADRLLGFRPVAAFRAVLVAARDAAVRLHGTHPPVLDMPDGFTTAAGLPRGRVGAVHRSLRWGAWGQLRRVWLGLQHAVELAVWGPTAHAATHEGGKGGEPRGGGQQQPGARGGLWETVGAEKVDRENLVLTMLMCALAGVLWLHVRQQGQRAARGVAAAPVRQVPVPVRVQQQQEQQAARTVPAVGGEGGEPRGESSRQQQEEEREEAPAATGTSRERTGHEEQARSSEGAGTSGRNGQQEEQARAESVVGEVAGTLDENGERVRTSSLSI